MKNYNYRIEKIRNLLAREVSLYIKNSLNVSNFQLNDVLLSFDLKKAKFLFVSVNGNLDDYVKMEKFLNKNSKKIRNELFRKLGLKIVPEFIFEYDRRQII